MTFEVVNSRSGHPIPIINGYHLHSAYNPIKEAKTFIEANLKKIAGESNFLIFGAGFLYHVNELVNYLESNNRTNYTIYIVEPNHELREYCSRINSHPKNIKMVENTEPNYAFSDKSFVEFLSLKPALLIHQPSFNLDKEFYERFLKFKSSRNITDISENVASEHFRNALNHFSDMTIDEVITTIDTEKNLNFENLLISTFSKIAGNREEQL